MALPDRAWKRSLQHAHRVFSGVVGVFVWEFHKLLLPSLCRVFIFKGRTFGSRRNGLFIILFYGVSSVNNLTTKQYGSYPLVSKKEESILNAATELFSEFGFHAVGVDAIIARSKVAKMTFYKYFPSKEYLIERVLLRRDQSLRDGIQASIAGKRSPVAKLKAIFDWYGEWFAMSDFHGCMFIKASDEFPARHTGIRKVSRDHKAWLTVLLEDLLVESGAPGAKRLSHHLMIILDGLTVDVNLNGREAKERVRASWGYVTQLLSI